MQDNTRAYRKAYGDYYSNHFVNFHCKDQLTREYENKYYFWVGRLKKYVENIPRDCQALDIGCGLGHNIYALNKLGFKNVRGIDLSDEQIEICRKQGFEAYCENAITYLERIKDTFCLITMFDVIEHLTKDESLRLLVNIKDSLKSNGLLIIHTFNASHPFSTHARYIDITHEVGYTSESLREILKISGFENIEVLQTHSFNHRGGAMCSLQL